MACGRRIFLIYAATILPFVAFLVAGVVEAFVPGAGAAETAKRVCKVVGEWLLGFCGFFTVVAIAKGD